MERDPILGSFQWRHLTAESETPSARGGQCWVSSSLAVYSSVLQALVGSFPLNPSQRLGLSEAYMLGKAEGYGCRSRDTIGQLAASSGMRPATGEPMTLGNIRGDIRNGRGMSCAVNETTLSP